MFRRGKLRFKILVLSLFALTFLSITPRASSSDSGTVLTVSINGEITKATQVMAEDLLRVAETANACLVVLKVNTPGGELGPFRKLWTC